MVKKYRDISLSFAAHPGTGDVSVVSNESAVAQSIKNIVKTNQYERLFNPDLGTNITALLFEPWSDIVRDEMENRIRSSIENYEPRADVLDVDVEDVPEKNFVDITITYRTNTTDQDAKVNIALERLF